MWQRSAPPRSAISGRGSSALEAALAAAPDDPENAALRDRLRLVKGVLYFRLNDSFKARMWQQRRTIKDLDLALARSADPLDPRGARAQERADEQRRIRRARCRL